MNLLVQDILITLIENIVQICKRMPCLFKHTHPDYFYHILFENIESIFYNIFKTTLKKIWYQYSVQSYHL